MSMMSELTEGALRGGIPTNPPNAPPRGQAGGPPLVEG